MKERKKFRDKYIEATESVLMKLRYKTSSYDVGAWKWLKWELILLVAYHIASLVTIGVPTPVSLLLNTLLVVRFIINNTRENRKVVTKAKKQKKSAKNEYTSMHAMIAIGEIIAVGLMAVMILWLGVDNNIGQKELATAVILLISLFEGWKDINVSFFEATPRVF